MKFFGFFFLAAVAVLPALCLGLTCWSCNATSPPDELIWNKFYEGHCVPGEAPEKRRCGSTGDVEKDYICAKYVANIEGLEDRWIRCEENTDREALLGCISDTFANGKVERCFCDTDLCNVTGQIKSPGTAILINDFMSVIMLAAALLQ